MNIEKRGRKEIKIYIYIKEEMKKEKGTEK